MPIRTIKDTTGADISIESLRDKTKITDLTSKNVVLGGVDDTGAIVAVDPQALLLKPQWKRPALQNAWRNFGNGFRELAYCNDGPRTRITGSIAGGTSGTVVFILPAEFRPSENIQLNIGGRSGTNTTVPGSLTVTAATGEVIVGFEGTPALLNCDVVFDRVLNFS